MLLILVVHPYNIILGDETKKKKTNKQTNKQTIKDPFLKTFVKAVAETFHNNQVLFAG